MKATSNKYLLVVAGSVMIVALLVWMFDRQMSGPMFAISSLLYAYATLRAQDEMNKDDMVVRRLCRQQMLGTLCYVFAGILMVLQGWNMWIYLRHNEWVVLFAIGCVLYCYSTFRMAYRDN